VYKVMSVLASPGWAFRGSSGVGGGVQGIRVVMERH
jgi:hypothetical protein